VAKFVIAAISARGFAQAAVACGHEVIALDAFADADTQAICKQTFKLKFNENSVDKADFMRIFEQINLTEIEGFLYGSLFDHCPDVLAWVAHRIRLVGNAPEATRFAKSLEFFELMDDLNIQHPEVRLSPPEALKHWLCKQIGGAGGTHVRPASQAKSADYFQRKVAGTPVSMLFVADGKTARTIGFNQQFIAPTDEMPYRFAGAVSNIALQPSICAVFEHATQQLTKVLNLRGINSLDAVLENAGLDDEKLWILELNPRLSASFNLYENPMHQHLSGCVGSLADFQPQNKTSKAQLILYADDAVSIPTNFVWPSWVADIPALTLGESSVRIVKNMPICSVIAEAQSAEAASNLVQQRAEKLREMFL
jgi:uncharacterized protein